MKHCIWMHRSLSIRFRDWLNIWDYVGMENFVKQCSKYGHFASLGTLWTETGQYNTNIRFSPGRSVLLCSALGFKSVVDTFKRNNIPIQKIECTRPVENKELRNQDFERVTDTHHDIRIQL